MLTRRKCSYTFIELVIVVLVIGILAGISAPQFKNSFNNLQLNSFSRRFQASMNYLRERAIIEGKPVYLNIDDSNKEYWAALKGADKRSNTYPIPKGLSVILEAENKGAQVWFYPDGSIGPVDISIIGSNDRKIDLTTKGVYGRVKIKAEE